MVQKGEGGIKPTFPHLRALDGLRGLAVLAVLAFHADFRFAQGGFLGVEIFFVISGFLITSIMLSEIDASGRLDLRKFWARRANRLLPAVATTLVLVLGVAVLFYREEVASLRWDAASAAVYSTNWYYIFAHKSYFETMGRPSAFRHLWSLAIEEQFYFLWPLVVAFVIAKVKPYLRVIIVASMIAVSAVAMCWLYHPDADPSRVYYGTDTRASGLLIGALLALVYRPAKNPDVVSRWKWPLDIVALAGLSSLVAACALWSQYDGFLYRGGLAAVAFVTALTIWASNAGGATVTGWILGNPVARWLGTRSYSLYLWHWPVCVVTRPETDIAPWLSPVVRIVLSAALAEISYRLIEQPFRNGTVAAAWNRLMNPSEGQKTTPEVGYALGISASVLGLAALFISLCRAPVVKTDYELAHQQTDSPAADVVPSAQPIVATYAPGQDKPSIVSDSPLDGYPCLIVGDSVILDAVPEFKKAGMKCTVVAKVGAQVSYAITRLRSLKEQGSLAPNVIVHVGNNGPFTSKQFDSLMELLSDCRTVVFLNTKIPESICEPNNAVIEQGVEKYNNAYLLNWHDFSKDHAEWFYRDRTHLKPTGAKIYARNVMDLLIRLMGDTEKSHAPTSTG